MSLRNELPRGLAPALKRTLTGCRTALTAAIDTLDHQPEFESTESVWSTLPREARGRAGAFFLFSKARRLLRRRIMSDVRVSPKCFLERAFQHRHGAECPPPNRSGEICATPTYGFREFLASVLSIPLGLGYARRRTPIYGRSLDLVKKTEKVRKTLDVGCLLGHYIYRTENEQMAGDGGFG